MTSLQESKNRVLIVLLIMGFIAGAMILVVQSHYGVESPNSPEQPLMIIWTVVQAAALMRWFTLDARERNYRISRAQFIWLFALMVIAAPFYFWRTRGKQAWAATGRALLFYVGFCLSTLCGGLAALGALWVFNR